MLRVVHALRPDHATHIGGDLVQLHATVAAVAREGIDAEAVTLEDARPPVDIVHLYNLQLPAVLRGQVAIARARWPKARLVLSPILWPPDPRLMLGGPDWWARQRIARAWAGLVLRRRQMRRVLAAFDAVIPNSQAEKRRVARLYHVSPAKWEVVPNGLAVAEWPVVRSDETSDWSRVDGFEARPELMLACVARVEPYKNQRTLVRALAHLPSAGLIVVGPIAADPYGTAVRRAATRFPGRVAFLGSRERSEVQRLLALTDVHVLPSFRETPGLATLEAAAVGCEVVATRHGSTEEYLGDLASYADPTSPVSLAASINEVVARPRQPRLRSRVEELDWSKVGRRLADLYRRLSV
jgi:glycosyltransferase involved in cell wall biosynthesis